MTSLVAVYYAVRADDFSGSQVFIATTINRYGIPLFYCAHIVYCRKV